MDFEIVLGFNAMFEGIHQRSAQGTCLSSLATFQQALKAKYVTARWVRLVFLRPLTNGTFFFFFFVLFKGRTRYECCPRVYGH